MISRIIESSISPLLGGKKAIIIMGARQVGKSTLLQQMLTEMDYRTQCPPLNTSDTGAYALLADIG